MNLESARESARERVEMLMTFKNEAFHFYGGDSKIIQNVDDLPLRI